MTDIDEVKSKINILDVIGAKVQLKKAGRNFKALCPFHGEKTPSFMVNPERGTWHCFGCGKGGSVIDFVMEYNHVDFLEALEDLADKAGVKLERRQGETPEARLKQKIYEANHLASEFYHFLLTKHKLGEKAREYLKTRGISDKSAKTFMLGYSPNDWESLYRFLRKKGYDDEVLQKAGLVLRGSGRSPYYDRFRGRVMFALKNHRGNVVGFSGRLLDPEAKEAKYINTSETPVYIKGNVLYGLDVTKEAIGRSGEAIIMEGELDVISSFQEGIGNAVAIKGSALTEGHVNLLRRFCEKLLFALDSDVAGDAASRRGIELADHAGFDMKVVVMPEGKDPDDLARETPVLLKKAIKDAIPIYDYFLESASKRYDKKTAFGKKKISEELVPVLAKIENTIVGSHYAKILATAIDIPEDTITEAIRKEKARQAKGITGRVVEQPQAPPLSRIERLEQYLLALLLQGDTKGRFEDLREELAPDDFVTPAISRILKWLEAFLKSTNVYLFKDFLDSLPNELTQTVDEAMLMDVSEALDDPEMFARTWNQTLREIRKEHIREKMQGLTDRVREVGGNEKDIEGLQGELRDLTGKLSKLEKRD